MEETTTINTIQSSVTLFAPPVSSMIPFEAPVPVTNVIASPVVSVSSSQSVPASTNAVPPLKNANISTTPASPVAIHSILSNKCPICKEMYIETDIEAHLDICLEKTNAVSYSSFTSSVERENFSRKHKKVLNVRRSNSVKDVLAKCKLFFRDSITPIHVKFVEDPNTTDAGEPLREMFTLFYEQLSQYLFCGKQNQYVFRHDAHLVNNSDFENLGKLMAVGFLLGLLWLADILYNQ